MPKILIYSFSEPVFLVVSEFSLRYLLIFKDQILVVDIGRKILRSTSETILISEARNNNFIIALLRQ